MTVPQPIQELAEYLTKSGTGKSKVVKVIELGKTCSGAEEFLDRAKRVLPEGTMLKIYTFIQDKKPIVPCPTIPAEELLNRLDEPIVDPTTPQEPISEGLVSPVSDMNAKEAIEFIKAMDEVDTLQQILETDARKTVKDAASEQLKAIQSQ